VAAAAEQKAAAARAAAAAAAELRRMQAREDAREDAREASGAQATADDAAAAEAPAAEAPATEHDEAPADGHDEARRSPGRHFSGASALPGAQGSAGPDLPGHASLVAGAACSLQPDDTRAHTGVQPRAQAGRAHQGGAPTGGVVTRVTTVTREVEIEEVVAAAALPLPEAPRIAAQAPAAAANGPTVRARRADARCRLRRAVLPRAQGTGSSMCGARQSLLGACSQRESSGARSLTTTGSWHVAAWPRTCGVAGRTCRC